MILIAGLLGVVACAYGALVRWRREQRLERQKRSLRLTLQQMAHALRIGAGFQQALARASQESGGELTPEWRRLYQNLQIGRPLKDALEDLAQRVPLREMRWMGTAVRVSQQTGGSLAGILDLLAGTLREREALRDKIRALTAQGKASAVILSALPFVLLIALQIIAPDLVGPLFSTVLGQGLLAGVMILVATGALVMQQIIRLPED